MKVGYVHMYSGTYGGHRHMTPWSWSYTVVSYLTWVLATKPGSSEEYYLLLTTEPSLLT